MMQTDVSAASVSTSSTAVAYRTRVRGMVISPGSANGSVVLKDGGSSGTTLITIPTVATEAKSIMCFVFSLSSLNTSLIPSCP